jgi:hypothetical protein
MFGFCQLHHSAVLALMKRPSVQIDWETDLSQQRKIPDLRSLQSITSLT